MDPSERKDQLTGRSQLVRLYEANAAIEWPTENDLRFRDALANRISAELGLSVKGAPSPIAKRPGRE